VSVAVKSRGQAAPHIAEADSIPGAGVFGAVGIVLDGQMQRTVDGAGPDGDDYGASAARHTVFYHIFDKGLEDQAGNKGVLQLRRNVNHHGEALGKADLFDIEIKPLHPDFVA